MLATVSQNDQDQPEPAIDFILSAAQEWVPMDQIEPNPFRDIDNYPLDPSRMNALEASMRDTGVWPVFLGRRRADDPSRVQLAFAHHRWAVAKRMGLPGLHIAIAPLEDHQLLQIMGNENSEFWGNTVAHNNLTVRQARDYLDGLIDQHDWESFRKMAAVKFNGSHFSKILLSDFQKWKKYGVGEDAIADFLGRAWNQITVKRAIEQIGRSVKRITADNEEALKEKALRDAERREREAELERQRKETARAAEAKRKADEEAKAAAEAKRKADEKARRAREEAQRTEREARRAALEADEAERRQKEAELLEAQRRTKEAEEAERRRVEQAERIRRELEEAAEKAAAEEKARREEEARVRKDLDKLKQEEDDFIARWGDQYDYRAGELFQNAYQAKVFRNAVMSDKAIRAGLARDRHLPLAKEILRSFTPAYSSADRRHPLGNTQRPPVEERLNGENIAGFINRQIERLMKEQDEVAAAQMRRENAAGRVRAAVHDMANAAKRFITATAQATSEINRFAKESPGFDMRGLEVDEIRRLMDDIEGVMGKFRERTGMDKDEAESSWESMTINATATVLDVE